MELSSSDDTVDKGQEYSDTTQSYATVEEITENECCEASLWEQDLDKPCREKAASKHKNGGSNNMQTYAQKASCAERHVIHNDLRTKKCTCGKSVCIV